MVAKKRGLGRGLDALLNPSALAPTTEPAQAPASRQGGDLRQLPIEWLQPGRYQPRNDMSAEALSDLASSIAAQGIIQPIVVRAVASERFEIIAGERRWRAAQLAQLDSVPCLVREIPDEAAVAIALIENIQREDLNALEEAQALQRLLDEFGFTHQQVAEAVGKSRTAVSNLLRLNNLEPAVKPLLENGDIDMGHARALLALEGEQQCDAARQVAAKGMTVRHAEQLVKKLQTPTPVKSGPSPDPDVSRLERDLGERLGASVEIRQGSKGQGKLVIGYASLVQLDEILKRLGHE